MEQQKPLALGCGVQCVITLAVGFRMYELVDPIEVIEEENPVFMGAPPGLTNGWRLSFKIKRKVAKSSLDLMPWRHALTVVGEGVGVMHLAWKEDAPMLEYAHVVSTHSDGYVRSTRYRSIRAASAYIDVPNQTITMQIQAQQRLIIG